MEPENNNQEAEQANQETQTSPLHQITPVSKYSAMALFIILPFVGGYIGYTFAPEKVVEMEKVVKIENTVDGGVADNPQNTKEKYQYSLSSRKAAPDTFTENHPANYSIIKSVDDSQNIIVENVENLIPDEYRGEYSSVLDMTQLSSQVLLLEYAPYLEGNRYLFRLDAESLEVTNLGSFRDTTLSDDKNLLAVTDNDHSKIRFIETLTGAEVATFQSDLNGTAFGACEMSCYIFGRWIDNELFLFDSVKLALNFPEMGSITYLESHIFDNKNKQIRKPTEAEQQQFLKIVDATWR